MGLWSLGFRLGKALFVPGRGLTVGAASTFGIGGALASLDQSIDAQEAEFFCKYDEEINTAIEVFARHVHAAVFDAHWSAFSYGPHKSYDIAIANRMAIENSAHGKTVTAPQLYTINYNRNFAVNSSGDSLKRPDGLPPGIRSARSRGAESASAAKSDHRVRSERLQDALWDGGTLMVSRPPGGQSTTSSASTTARMSDEDFEKYLDDLYSTPADSALEDLEIQSARRDDIYYETSPSWTDSAKRQSRENFGRNLYGPSILNGECSHMDAKVFLVLAGVIDAAFSEAAASAYSGGYEIFAGGLPIMTTPGGDLLSTIATDIATAGNNSDDSGVANIVWDVNRLTASSLPLETFGGATARALWNGAFSVVDMLAMDLIPDAGMINDPCGKPPCGSD